MRSRLPLLALTVLLALWATPAAAHAPLDPLGTSRLAGDGTLDSGIEVHGHEIAAQHGRKEGHLPASRRNVELVGRLRVPGAGAGRIADVGAHGRYAYLGAFREPRCRRGGVYVVDIRNPARPRPAGFIGAAPGSFVGEGVQVVRLNTSAFRGELLVHNNEICQPENPKAVGGISLVDVRNPRRPRKLVDGVGDRSFPDGTESPTAHQVHSAFVWQDGPRAFVVMVDDEESADVDIMEITDPRNPKLISETNLNAFGVEQPDVHGESSFLHDMVVKRIRGVQTMLASYWDGGYVQLNVNDPARPLPIAHTDFAKADPQRAARGQGVSSEGNAHQAEYDRRNRYFLAADEDFDPFRITARLTSGSDQGREFMAVQGQPVTPLATGGSKDEDEEDDGSKIDSDTSLVGTTAFIGMACDDASVPAASSTGASVAVVERGICTFTDKARRAAAAGYKGAVVFNRAGPDGGCEELASIVLDGEVPFLLVGRSEGFRLLGAFDPDSYRCTSEEGEDGGEDTPAPPVGTRGASVDIRAQFDGWGYVHLYDRRTQREVDTWSIREAQSKRYAQGFGDLSVHEVATDPDDTGLAYFSHYAGGFRVARFGPRGIREVGRYIDAKGSNFWGVQVHKHPNGRKYVLASDRDSGLVVFRYTGP